MDLLDAEDLAIKKMGEYGLLRDGWHFEWDRAKARAGLCSNRRKTISMSELVIAVNDEEFALDTILHEIAHALVKYKKGVKSHGKEWQEMAAKLGASTTFAADTVVGRPEAKWTGSCGICGWSLGRYRLNKSLRTASCPVCGNRRYNAAYPITWVQNY